MKPAVTHPSVISAISITWRWSVSNHGAPTDSCGCTGRKVSSSPFIAILRYPQVQRRASYHGSENGCNEAANTVLPTSAFFGGGGLVLCSVFNKIYFIQRQASAFVPDISLWSLYSSQLSSAGVEKLLAKTKGKMADGCDSLAVDWIRSIVRIIIRVDLCPGSKIQEGKASLDVWEAKWLSYIIFHFQYLWKRFFPQLLFQNIHFFFQLHRLHRWRLSYILI